MSIHSIFTPASCAHFSLCVSRVSTKKKKKIGWAPGCLGVILSTPLVNSNAEFAQVAVLALLISQDVTAGKAAECKSLPDFAFKKRLTNPGREQARGKKSEECDRD